MENKIVDSSLHSDFDLTKLLAMRELAEVRLKYAETLITLYRANKISQGKPLVKRPYLTWLLTFHNRQLDILNSIEDKLVASDRKVFESNMQSKTFQKKHARKSARLMKWV